MAFDYNQELAKGYQDWWNTPPADWPNNKVGQLLANGVRLIDHDGTMTAGRANVLQKLASLRATTEVDIGSVEVGTGDSSQVVTGSIRQGKVSVGRDRERVPDADDGREYLHTCFDRFEWNAGNPPKIKAIYVCEADSL